MNTNIVEVNNIQFSYNERIIFNDISLKIPQGKIVAILGPSGTGKTTLLRLISGQLTPDQGEIIFNNTSLKGIAREQLFNLRRQMGMLFQTSGLFTNLSVYDNVAFPLRENTNLCEKLIGLIVMMKLELVGLLGAATLNANQLSGGMARRVALARAIALDPSFIIYDEPFTGLDPISMGVIVQLIKKINETLGMTSLIVTHDVSEVCTIADYIYLLSNGKVIANGSPESLLASGNPAVYQFMHGVADGVVPYHYPRQKSYYEELSDVCVD